ncbi:MAG TPA: T9SS type A sorting domain-containing protein [Bacteroidales bacterium]|nr:T9SS type A sorting domain-containing protein [Bacteroidales bacterium]HQB20972.1 T9SS type A sorting domain-containing protein [Bacteroidales bacterium]
MKKIFITILCLVLGLSLSVKVWGQVNISAGNTVTETFSIGTSTTANLPTGWRADKNTSTRSVGTYAGAGTTTNLRAGNDMSNSAQNGIYNFGAGPESTATDRAVGGISSKDKSKSVNVYVQLKNNGSTDISSFTISYDVEKYRNGTNSAGFTIQMYYSTNGTSWTTAGNDFKTSFTQDDDNEGFTSAPGETQSVTNKTLNQTIAPNGFLYLAWNYSVTSGSTTSSAQALGIDNVSITANGGSTPDPTISVNPASLINFSYEVGEGPSSNQSFTVSGSNLTGDITISAPTNYEISKDSIFGSSLTLTQTGGTVAPQTIYVRLKAGLTEGTYNEIINISSSGATAKTVTCSGSVVVPSSYCFEEYFTNFSDGTHAVPSNNNVANSLNTYTSTPGWTGDYIYSAGGEIKLGTGSGQGYITTPTINLSDGDATIHFDVASWSGDNASIKVFHASNGTNFNQVGSEISLTSSYSTKSIVISGGTINSKIKIEAKNQYNCRFYLDNFQIECADPNPIINVSSSSLTNFEYYLGYGPSETQSFTVSGTSLSTSITLTAPTNYEISLNSESGFSNSLSINLTGGIVPETLVYVRLKAGLDLGSYNLENITASSTGADNKTISCSGSVILAPVTDLSLICSSNTTAEISWASPECNYDGVVIAFRNSTNPPHALSLDPSDINANLVFGSGTSFGTTTPYSYVVYKGTGNSVLVSGLTAGQTYKVKAYVYKGTNWIADAQCPTITVSELGLSNVSLAQKVDGNAESELSWVLPSAACFDQILVVARQGSSVAYTPTGDGSTLTANPIFGSGDDVGSNQYVVYKETGTGLTITGLTNDETYYAKIFVRKGTDWSSGVELVLNPKITTALGHGDLAILAVNTQSGFGDTGDEISIVSFKDIAPNTSLDFTDNGYERATAGKWGDTEGTIRLTRKSSSPIIEAGKVITFEIQPNGVSSDLTLGTHINIYVDGLLDNTNWTTEKLGGSNRFDLNTKDQLWIMQNGNWVNPSGTHDAIYTGNVIYGWTATGWKSAPGYDSSQGSTIYPGCECATTDVEALGTDFKSKVKYTGSLTATSKYEWIDRINDPANWTGWKTNAPYNDSLPDYNYKGGIQLQITAGDAIESKWMGYKNSAWCNCANWYNLRVPNENTDVEISAHNAERFDLKLSAHADSLAVCKDLIVKGDVYNVANASLKVKGDFTLDGGSMNFNTNAINFEIGGNISIDNMSNFKVSQANTKLNGSEIQNINGNSEVIFGTLTIDKPSSYVVLAKNIQVNTLNLTKGKITTETNRVYVNNTASTAITNASNLSYINGNLRRAVASTGSYAMPVGNASNIQLATINLISSTGLTYLDARFDSHITNLDIASLNLFVDGTILQTILNPGYWTIAPNSGLSAISYDISLDMRGASNIGAQAEQHTVIKRDNSSSNWYLQGNHTNSTQSISGNSIHAERTELTSFSEFSIAKHEIYILPVELVSFNVNCDKNFVELNWVTASETNNDYFIVQRSQDATNWKNLDKIQGAGFSSSELEYKHIDKNQVSENVYYRLVQVDFDGTKTISNIVNVNCINKFEIPNISIYPNPANDILNFSQAQTYEILDIQGRVLMQSKTKQNSVNISELKEGMYFIKFENELLKFIKY